MDDVVNGNVFVEQAAVCIVVAILPTEEVTTASLWIEVPKQHTQAPAGKKTGKVYGCSGFSNASFDVVYGDLFQSLKLLTK
jgi:hypothetical protein